MEVLHTSLRKQCNFEAAYETPIATQLRLVPETGNPQRHVHGLLEQSAQLGEDFEADDELSVSEGASEVS